MLIIEYQKYIEFTPFHTLHNNHYDDDIYDKINTTATTTTVA
jgi:hypothetical protein